MHRSRWSSPPSLLTSTSGLARLCTSSIAAVRILGIERRRMSTGTLLNQREYGRQDEQTRDGCSQQSSDHGSPKRGRLFCTGSERDRHWNHPNDHGQAGHKDRPHTALSTMNGGVDRWNAPATGLLRERNQKDCSSSLTSAWTEVVRTCLRSTSASAALTCCCAAASRRKASPTAPATSSLVKESSALARFSVSLATSTFAPRYPKSNGSQESSIPAILPQTPRSEVLERTGPEMGGTTP